MERLQELLFLKGLKGVGKAKIYKTYMDVISSVASMEELVSYVKKTEEKLTEDEIRAAAVNSSVLYDSLSKSNITVITVCDANYPEKLKVMGNKRPLILYAKGDISLLDQECIAVIGTRSPSKESMVVEEVFLKEMLKDGDPVIVSGLALGCDTIAHKTTVEQKKKTIAVLPGGLNRIYPKENKDLSEEILATGGCIITEYEPDKEATTYTFVERDAIVAALSERLLVIECSTGSGTMKTVEAAEKYGKIVAYYSSKLMDTDVFSGNKQISNQKNSIAITVTEDLKIFLDTPPQNSRGRLEEYQMTLTDLMNKKN